MPEGGVRDKGGMGKTCGHKQVAENTRQRRSPPCRIGFARQVASLSGSTHCLGKRLLLRLLRPWLWNGASRRAGVGRVRTTVFLSILKECWSQRQTEIAGRLIASTNCARGLLETLTSRATGYLGFLHEPGNGFCSTLDLKLVKDICQVVFHRFVAQAKLNGNFFICFSFSQKRQDQALLRRESRGPMRRRSKV